MTGLQTGFRPLSWVLFTALLIALSGIQMGGERLGALGAVLYLPMLVWLLPFLVMFLVGIILRERVAVIHVAGAAFVLFWYADFQWAFWCPVKAGVFKVVTNNIGQSNHQTPAGFIKKENPDAVVLQEAFGRIRSFSSRYPGFHVAAQGEFVLMSKHLINRAKLLRELSWHGRPVVARFEIEVNGQGIAIYSVHMPTPRNDLVRLWGRDFAEEILDPLSTSRHGGRMPVNESMHERVQLARRIVEVFTQEQMPFIVAGDFNMPSNGYIRRVFSGELQDAFASCGRGYGFTFPGYTRNPLSFFQPWLRLDYLFAGNGFRPCYVRTEPERQSQHRAVAAGFVLEKVP